MLQIRFEAEPIGGATIANPTLHNELQKVYINNWPDVNALNLEEFVAAGNACEGLTTHLGIQYTADHELMLGWSVGISSAAPAPFPPMPSGGSTRPIPPGASSGIPAPAIDITAWPRCSYRVTLSTRRKLTDGEIDDTGHTNELTFCKK
jgi:hypothetical protein